MNDGWHFKSCTGKVTQSGRGFGLNFALPATEQECGTNFRQFSVSKLDAFLTRPQSFRNKLRRARNCRQGDFCRDFRFSPVQGHNSIRNSLVEKLRLEATIGGGGRVLPEALRWSPKGQESSGSFSSSAAGKCQNVMSCTRRCSDKSVREKAAPPPSRRVESQEISESSNTSTICNTETSFQMDLISNLDLSIYR